MDWKTVLPPVECSYLFGNPPFRGHQYRTASQKRDMSRVWGNEGQVNRLDYVTCWFNKAAQYTSTNKNVDTAFVSTNSITQGEQSGILWPFLFAAGLSIHFAHRTFQWNNEARGKAAVHCVIIGMTWDATRPRTIYEYATVRGDPHASPVGTINGYLIDGPQYSVPSRSRPPFGRVKMGKGSQPTDGARLKDGNGHYITTSNLILDDADKVALIGEDPITKKWLRPYVGGDELISGVWRWCLWLKDADATEIRNSKPVQVRLARVKKGRLLSPTLSVQAFARFPTLFTQDRQPSVSYLGFPEVSSGTRDYIPMAFLPPRVIASNKLQIVPKASVFDFGILTSAMHMAWMRTVGGRLKSDYSYSPSIYNSFPWPTVTAAQTANIEVLAQAVLDTRSTFPKQTLDDLYDPDSMPVPLRKAHDKLDAAVDRLYRRAKFNFERERVEHLFELFRKEAAPLDTTTPATPRRRKRSAS